MRVGLAVLLALALPVTVARADPAETCARLRSDDNVRPYDPR